jgi:hypothetical protein
MNLGYLESAFLCCDYCGQRALEESGMKHRLKVWPEYFAPIFRGEKSFEIRKNDRDYMIGDVLNLCEFDPKTEKFSGRSINKEVIYIADNLEKFGLPKDVVVMSIR